LSGTRDRTRREKKDEVMWRVKTRKKKSRQWRKTIVRKKIGVITLKETITRFSRFQPPPHSLF
jgi:hypothetical protein